MKEKNDDQLSESVSTLVDGEQSNSDLAIQSLSACEKLQRRWQQYHLIRDALTDELPQQISTNFSSRVMEAIQAEPTVIAPRILKLGAPIFNVPSSMAKPLIGMAIAATVAAVTVIGVQTFQAQDPVQFQQANNTEIRSIRPMPGQTTVATTGPRHFHASDKVRWEGSQEELQEVLNDYLMTHTESAQTGQIRGIVTYARLAGFNGKTQ